MNVLKGHLTGALARLRLVTRARAALVTLSILGTALVVAPGASPAAAAPLRQTSIITNNIQGEGDGTASKWSSQVQGFARSAEIVLIQEAGPQGPSHATQQPDVTTADGDTVRHSTWQPFSSRLQPDPYHVFFLQTDDYGGRGQGGRVNLATITHDQPDEVRVVTNPMQRGRAALGVRFGDDWYFNVHGLSGGGGDSNTLLTAIRDSVRSWGAQYRWTAGGDFNVDPRTLQRRGTFPIGARVYNSRLPTHQSGNELDYFVSSDGNPGDATASRMNAGSSDHYPVWWNGMRAAAEPPELKVMPLGDSTFGTAEKIGYGATLAGSLYALISLVSKKRDVPVDFVGSGSTGQKGDPAYEGAPGEQISDIAKRSMTALPKYRPNIVTLQAGTYDMRDGKQDGAAQRLKDLVDQIEKDNPGTVVALATLGPATDPAVQSRITAYNAEIRTMVGAWQSAGRHVVLADTGAMTTEDLSGDGLTPNDSGNKKIAEAFEDAIRWALVMDWVAEPRAGDGKVPLKVMVVGDSMSQGYEGDWTWRYRLWEWFKKEHVDVDFVGPYQGTRPQESPKPPPVPPLQGEAPPPAQSAPVTSGAYAPGVAKDFDADHFSVWGRQAAQDKTLIAEQVAKYQPDLLLVGLGFNDMGWFVSGPEGTLDSMRTLVDQARAAKPDLNFALANVPQRTSIGGRDDLPVNTTKYNSMLAAAIPSWNNDKSRVALVDWAGNYSCDTHDCPAGYDGLHPNALGEYQIAQAFVRTLHNSYGLGSQLIDIPTHIPNRPTLAPDTMEIDSGPSGITLNWEPVFGAHGYTVRHRIKGSGTWNETPVKAARFDTTWTLDGWEWEYQVRTDNGEDGKSEWSHTVGGVAHPKTAAAPKGIVTRATATGVDVSWDAATGPYTDTIDRYEIITWDRDTPGAFLNSTAVRGNSARIDGLREGHHYLVAVATWNAAGGGMPGVARSVTVGAGTPPAPTGLKVISTDATTVQLSWNGSVWAAGYRVWIRNVNDDSGSKHDGSGFKADEYITNETSRGIAYLVPGVWNYEFCVTAINGEAESSKSNCVIAPKPSATAQTPAPTDPKKGAPPSALIQAPRALVGAAG
ncbi:GDSL-type esterase/lipase family protein [Kitasatospora aureofaciens]|uniref:GDSL-type esterase/lipase family protein n=1 Tax=Kitasatospora aureofaciens TaxID=1894 RepID=UPI0036F468B8